MCAPQDCRPILTLLTAGRELDDLCFQLSQIAELIAATSDRVADHHGADPTTNDRASAFIAATTLMLRGVQRRAEGLTDRMLNASEI